MEQSPHAVFYGKELEERFPELFHRALKDRLLHRLETRTDWRLLQLRIECPLPRGRGRR